ncbi:MAG: phage terminase large subunit family protein [Planctomycetaceae bacterium]|nr:phage terminase large subunit family protein [Planctomycetaceae bacterium]
MVALTSNTRDELNRFLGRSRSRRVRSPREFAEQELVLPDGPHAGRRFRCHRQPYTALWLEAIADPNWTRCVATGPTQSGKTWSAFLVPLLYHLFEIGETVICGVPDMDMATDKWREDILPVIEQCRFREFLPRRGSGSRGGKAEAFQFRNGATLKFMSGGGGDKSRAGFTSRVVVITETDGMDRPGTTSRESDKVTQLEARTRAYGSRKRIYLECTVSTTEGRTWQEYQQGTASRILLPCPHCHVWVLPEREHLVGWKEAPSQAEARESGTFHCPACAHPWTESERTAANQQARLVHDGEELTPAGTLTGVRRPTETLGFRWSAVHNLFLTAGDLAADEWRASRSADEENAEREMRQFVWCLPVTPTRWDETGLSAEEITRRLAPTGKGIVPAGTEHLTAAIDLGKYLCHWVVVAWSEGATGQVVDYGRIEVASPELGVEQALLVALREFRDTVLSGFEGADRHPQHSDGLWRPESVWIDAGYMTEVVYQFCREVQAPFGPAVGRGASQQRTTPYSRPTQTGNTVKRIGEGYHIAYLRAARMHLAEVDADHWKTFVHQRLTTPVGQPGALTLFQAPSHEHLSLTKHLTAERQTEEFVVGKGVVTRWERVRRNNHWLDALYNACAAGHLVGVRLLESSHPPRKTYGKLSDLHRAKHGAGPAIDAAQWKGMGNRWWT